MNPERKSKLSKSTWSLRVFVALQLSQFAEGIRNLLPQLQAIAEIIPAPTLEWKLKLLGEGSRYDPEPSCMQSTSSKTNF